MMNKIHQHLLSLQDQKYRDFNTKIIEECAKYSIKQNIFKNLLKIIKR